MRTWVCLLSASILSMGFFAAAYGELTKRLSITKDIEFIMTVLSASMSFLVGILWLILLYLGILDEVFD